MNFQTAPQAGDGSPAVAGRPSSTRERATLSLRALRQPGAHSGAGLDPSSEYARERLADLRDEIERDGEPDA